MLVDTTSFSEEDRKRVSRLMEAYRVSWRPVQFEEISGFLGQYLPFEGDPIRQCVLVELIGIDMERRWANRQSVLIEQYFAEFPEVNGTNCPPPLLAHEFQCRQKSGDPVPWDSYETRFPNQFNELQESAKAGIDTLPPATEPVKLADGTAAVPIETGHPTGDPRGSVVPLVGGYTLMEPIGSGQAGDVWRALAPGEIQVAIKMIRRDSRSGLTEMEHRALEVMKQMRHSFLLQIQAYWQQDIQLLIVMELADQSLEERLEQCLLEGHQGIPVDELIGYMRESAEALDYLHSEAVLHRDIKPARIC